MAYHPFRHLGLKVLAIGLATALWLAVAGQHVVERTLRVPLEFRNSPPRHEVVGEVPSTVDVRLRGSSVVLSRLGAGDVVAVLDLTGARAGSRLFHIPPEQVTIPYGVDVMHVMPSTIQLELEVSGARAVPIKPAIEGDPAPGFVVGKVSVDPPMVSVSGPESRLKQLLNATTEPVSVAGASAPVDDSVTVGVPDPSLRMAAPQTAVVRVDIVPAPVERDLAGVAVRARNLASGRRVQVSPPVVKVAVRGAREALDALRPGSVQSFVDLAGLAPGRYNLAVQFDRSPDFGVIRVEPATVDVRIK
jgi:YbbR domain-containing protein